MLYKSCLSTLWRFSYLYGNSVPTNYYSLLQRVNKIKVHKQAWFKSNIANKALNEETLCWKKWFFQNVLRLKSYISQNKYFCTTFKYKPTTTKIYIYCFSFFGQDLLRQKMFCCPTCMISLLVREHKLKYLKLFKLFQTWQLSLH